MSTYITAGFVGLPNLVSLNSQACTASQFYEPDYIRLSAEICQTPRFHRKQWEYIYILRALEQFDLLGPHSTGIGFGCGKEPLAAVMAKRGARVVVTDIPPLTGSDTHWGAHSVMDLFYGGICSEEHFRQQVSFKAVDMNAIPDDLGRYDFLWSCCALEHLGSLAAGARFIEESLKCLRPGGIAVHTTEYNTASDKGTLESTGLSLYRPQDLIDIQNSLTRSGHLTLPLNLYTGDLEQDNYVDLPPYEQATHLKLLIGTFVVTSFGLVVQKNPNVECA